MTPTGVLWRGVTGESHKETPTGRDPRGESWGVTHRETQRENHRSPRGEPRDDSERDTHESLGRESHGETSCGSHEECHRETPTGVSQGCHGGRLTWGVTGRDPQRDTHRRRSTGRDSEAETPLEGGGSPWGHPRGDSKIPSPTPRPAISHPTDTHFPSHGTQKDGRRVKGEPGAGHVPAGKRPLARSNQSHLY